MQAEPLRGTDLRAALAAIIAAPVRDLPPVTEEPLAVRYTPEQAGRMGKRVQLAKIRAARPAKAPKRRGPGIAALRTMARIRALWDSGLKVAEICEQVDRSERSVQMALRRSGVSFRIGQGKAAMGRDEFAARYREIGATALAGELGLRIDGVRKRARRMGLLP